MRMTWLSGKGVTWVFGEVEVSFLCWKRERKETTNRILYHLYSAVNLPWIVVLVSIHWRANLRCSESTVGTCLCSARSCRP